LTPSDFGVFAAAVTVIEFARPLSTLSMDHALVQSKSLGTGSVALASLFALGLSSFVAALFMLNANTVLLLYDDPGVPPLLNALALTFPLAAVSSLLLADLRRRLIFRELSIIALVSSVMASLTSVGAALAGWGVWALVTGYYTDLVLRALFALLLVRLRFHRPRIDEGARGLLRFGVGSTLSLMLNFWALNGDYVVIGSALGPKPLGYYSRAYQLISTVPGMLNRLHQMVLFPAFSRAQGDRPYLDRALRVGTEATAALTLPLCAWGLVLGPEIIAVLLGPGWDDAVLPFQILSLGVYFRSAYGLSASVVFATGHVFSLSACQAIYGILIVVGAFFGAKWGIAGVATATLVALLVFSLLLYALAARVSGASLWSFLAVHAHPAIVFVIVLTTAALGRLFLSKFDSPPVVILVATVMLGVIALAGATRMLGRSLWGDFLYEQGLAGLGRHAPGVAVDKREHDDFNA
jgi:PST family polysaccharide transporter